MHRAGPMCFNGVYHLFYQYNPYGPIFTFDQMHWGHSVSHDLINWIPVDHAMAPTEPFDINSCYSGSVTILPGNKPVMMYTGVDSEKRQVQNLAFPKDLSDPYLREWIKYTGNPVIEVPDGIQPGDFRDPTTAWVSEDGKWRIIVGSRKDKDGIAFLYRSEDFISWTKSDSSFYKVAGIGIWECPDFFPVSVDSKEGVDASVLNSSVKHVLKLGLMDGKDYYMIGNYSYEKDNYAPQNELTLTTPRFDHGKYYGSKSFFDPIKNRRILIAWVNECDSEADKQLVQWPIEEIKMLHENEVCFRNKKLEGGSLHEILGITASQADVTISFKLSNLEEAEELDPSWIDDPRLICSEKDASNKGKIGPFGLLALASHDLTEQTAIFFRIEKTSYGAFVDVDPQQDEISLRTLIDHSIVESFGGGGKTCITARVYPTLAIGNEARLFAFNDGTESVVISELSAWSVKKALINVDETISDTN
ncbi:Concanavalin A-like lectin/glucanase superfamily [Cynara cardunculus var. scolymus]|uniref:Concanavalin A-like lectin/glucanase superfamily n=1 Tax=Cynara cardunculus var. scolymus TaxID=59895 RepID=A0A103XDD3_CYNCS|nr:Concanavalin A-like lectin/glucanase superfamily [Cynara cardunculus var. scolymus]